MTFILCDIVLDTQGVVSFICITLALCADIYMTISLYSSITMNTVLKIIKSSGLSYSTTVTSASSSAIHLYYTADSIDVSVSVLLYNGGASQQLSVAVAADELFSSWSCQSNGTMNLLYNYDQSTYYSVPCAQQGNLASVLTNLSAAEEHKIGALHASTLHHLYVNEVNATCAVCSASLREYSMVPPYGPLGAACSRYP
jgi:hypothetical protein